MRVEYYNKPATLAAALQEMRQDNMKALAGGTDIVIALNEKAIHPRGLIDLSGIAELKEISLVGDELHIGSMATFSQIETNAMIQTVCPMLAAAAASVGSTQIRSIATIGGNLANAATAADTVPALMALDSMVVIRNADKERTLRVTDVPTGLNKTCLAPDELICKFIVPVQKNCFMDFEKIGRRKALAIARINMGMVLSIHGGIIEKAAIAYGAIGKTAYRVTALEEFLVGKLLDDSLIDHSADLIEQIVTDKLQGRKTTPYKRVIAAAVLRQALLKAREEYVS